MKSPSHKHSLLQQSLCLLLTLHVTGLYFEVTFPRSANFGIQTLFLNFEKILFELRSKCNRFSKRIYLTADTRLKQVTFQSALVSLFSFCMLETFTTLLSSHIINLIVNFLSDTPKTQGKYSQRKANMHHSCYKYGIKMMRIFFFFNCTKRFKTFL